MFRSYWGSWKTQALLQQRKRRSLLSQLLISLRNKQVSTRVLSRLSLIAAVLRLSQTFPFVVLKAFCILKQMENHVFFLISLRCCRLLRRLSRCYPLSRHVAHRSRVSQGVSHLWTLSKATPIDVSRVGIEEASKFTPWVGRCGHWAAGRHLYSHTGV